MPPSRLTIAAACFLSLFVLLIARGSHAAPIDAPPLVMSHLGG